MSLNPTATSLSLPSSTSTCLISVKQLARASVPSTLGKAAEGQVYCELRRREDSKSKDETEVRREKAVSERRNP
jgi:hypothetical protein